MYFQFVLSLRIFFQELFNWRSLYFISCRLCSTWIKIAVYYLFIIHNCHIFFGNCGFYHKNTSLRTQKFSLFCFVFLFFGLTLLCLWGSQILQNPSIVSIWPIGPWTFLCFNLLNHFILGIFVRYRIIAWHYFILKWKDCL